MLRIEEATEENIDLIRELTMQVWPQTYTPIVGAVQVAYMLEQFYAPTTLSRQMNEGHTFLICYDDDAPVAFAAFEGVEQGVYKLHKIYILPGQQGKGIGKYLIGEISTRVKSLGSDCLRLNVNRYNTPAIGFYEKAGFRKVKDEDIEIGQGYYMNDHVLELTL